MLSGIPLRAWRQRKALSQRDLADLSGVGVATIVRIEHGQTARPSTIRKLAQALDVTPELLIAGPEPPATPRRPAPEAGPQGWGTGPSFLSAALR